MDEMREETEYERALRETRESKYNRDFGPGYPASMQPGTDLAPVFWIVFFAIAFVVLVYLGSHSGG